MKIALITYNFYPSNDGIAHTLTNLCKSFQDKEVTMYVFTQDYKGNRCLNILDKNDYKFTDFSLLLKNKKNLYFFIISIFKIIVDKKISLTDRFHIILYLLFRPKILIKTINNVGNLYPYFKKLKFDIIFSGAAGVRTLTLSFILSRIFKIKIISFAHGNEFLVSTWLSLRTYYIKNLDKIIMHTENLKKLLIRIHHINKNKIILLPPGINLKDYAINKSKDKLREDYNIHKDTFILLSVGRHISRKNFKLVIKAVSEIKRRNSDIKIKYYLIGTGPETENLKSLVKKLKMENDIRLLGYCNNEKRNNFYKLSDVFIMPSIEEKESIEGFGVVFLEANYYNLPVVGSRSGGITESILDRKTGLLVKSNDLKDLVEKILYLYNNKDIRIEMGKLGYERIIEKYSWEKLYKDYLKVFKELINEN